MTALPFFVAASSLVIVSAASIDKLLITNSSAGNVFSRPLSNLNESECTKSFPYSVRQEFDNDKADYRLPSYVRPEHYDLRIITSLGEEGNEDSHFRFDGLVHIQLNAAESTAEIRLHAADLDIDRTNITLKEASKGSSEIKISSVKIDSTLEQLIIRLEEPLQEKSSYLLIIAFKGRLLTDLYGFYRTSHYEKGSNKTEWLAVTQFQPKGARRAFPCFDEPKFKATLILRLGHHKRFRSLSNMPANNVEKLPGHDDFVLTTFNKSVPMSTYILAWVVFDYVEVSASEQQKNPQVSVWVHRTTSAQALYAAEAAPKILKFYEAYFEERFPLPKLDLISLPDARYPAMENWGLITYREEVLLIDDKTTSTVVKDDVLKTMAHEIVHQWFGNLVTMKWWSDLWLNEGFASFLLSFGAKHINPQWAHVKFSESAPYLLVTNFDSLQSSHPVSVPLKNQSQIDEIFDPVTYDKGSFVVRMLHTFLGEKAFREGLAHYIHKHRYENAEQDDLWEALTRKAHEQKSLPTCLSVKQVMDTWTVQAGYPLVTVIRHYDNDSDAESMATVTQNRYFTDSTLNDSKSCWYVPLTYTTEKRPNFTDTMTQKWMTCDGEGISIKVPATKDQWVLFNIGLNGLYRVQYDKRNWDLLAKALLSPYHGGIPESHRIQILADVFQLARSGHEDYSTALNVAKYLRSEKSSKPLDAALSQLGFIERIARRSDRYKLVRDYMGYLISPAMELLQPLESYRPEKNKTEDELQTLLAGYACLLNLSDCRRNSSALLQQWMQANASNYNETRFNAAADAKINPVPTGLRYVVYCYAIQEGGEAEWQFLWRRFINAIGSERNILLSALACSSDSVTLERLLDRVLSNSSDFRVKDKLLVFSSIASNKNGFQVASNTLFSRINDIHLSYGILTYNVGTYIKIYATHVTTEAEFNKLLQLIEQNKEILEASAQTVHQAIETARLNWQWKKHYFDEVVKIMEQSLDQADKPQEHSKPQQ